MRILGNMALNEHLHSTIVRSGNNFTYRVFGIQPSVLPPLPLRRGTLISQQT